MNLFTDYPADYVPPEGPVLTIATEVCQKCKYYTWDEGPLTVWYTDVSVKNVNTLTV